MAIDLETLGAIGTWELTLPELTLQWSDGARALLGQTLPEKLAALLRACPEPDRLDVAAALSGPPRRPRRGRAGAPPGPRR
jgi:hypothetical protein